MAREVMTAKQVAEYLQFNEMTVYKLAREGKIPASRIGRAWRFRKDLIDQWLKQGASVRAELIIRNGEKNEEERRFYLSSTAAILGTDPTNNIALLGDDQISRRHALICPEDGQYVIIDLDSATGTYVNGEPISRQVLKNGDEIRLGETILIFQTQS